MPFESEEGADSIAREENTLYYEVLIVITLNFRCGEQLQIIGFQT